MREQQEERSRRTRRRRTSPTPASAPAPAPAPAPPVDTASAVYHENHVPAGNMLLTMDNAFHNGHQSVMFGADNNNHFFQFDPSNPDQVQIPQEHNPQAILNTSDYDFLQNFFTNPDSLNQIQLNPYDFATDDKAAVNLFAAAAAFDQSHGTINPSTIATSQPSLHKTHVDSASATNNHMPFAVSPPPALNSQNQHPNMSAADFTAASTIHSLKSTSAPHYSSHTQSQNVTGTSSWGNFMMPNPLPQDMPGFQGSGSQSGASQPRHHSLNGRNVMYFAGIPQHVPTSELFQRHFSVDFCSPYLRNQAQPHSRDWNPSQPSTSSPSFPPSQPRLPVSFGTDPNFESLQYRNPTPSQPPDKEGNLLNVPLAAQAAQAGMRSNSGFKADAPSPSTSRNGSLWGSMSNARPGSCRESDCADQPGSRKRQKSQTEHENDADWLPNQGGYVGGKTEDSDGDPAEGARSPKRPRPSISRLSQTAISPIAEEDEDAVKRRGVKKSRETLSEHQKRQHHIQSEKKRREIINQGYAELSVLVPCLGNGKSGLSRSECLQEVASYIESLVDGTSQIMTQLGLTDADLMIAPDPPLKVESISVYGP